MVKKIRLNIMLNPKTTEKIEEIAKIKNVTRSTLIERVLCAYYREFFDGIKGQEKLW